VGRWEETHSTRVLINECTQCIGGERCISQLTYGHVVFPPILLPQYQWYHNNRHSGKSSLSQVLIGYTERMLSPEVLTSRCLICFQRLPYPSLRPTVCTKGLCKYKFQNGIGCNAFVTSSIVNSAEGTEQWLLALLFLLFLLVLYGS
jgi:hypothetical protein